MEKIKSPFLTFPMIYIWRLVLNRIKKFKKKKTFFKIFALYVVIWADIPNMLISGYYTKKSHPPITQAFRYWGTANQKKASLKGGMS